MRAAGPVLLRRGGPVHYSSATASSAAVRSGPCRVALQPLSGRAARTPRSASHPLRDDGVGHNSRGPNGPSLARTQPAGPTGQTRRSGLPTPPFFVTPLAARTMRPAPPASAPRKKTAGPTRVGVWRRPGRRPRCDTVPIRRDVGDGGVVHALKPDGVGSWNALVTSRDAGDHLPAIQSAALSELVRATGRRGERRSRCCLDRASVSLRVRGTRVVQGFSAPASGG
jgi:hypothetical protein